MKNFSFTISVLSIVLAFSLATCRHSHVHVHTRNSIDKENNPAKFEDLTLKNLLDMLNSGKKSFGLKTDDPLRLMHALNTDAPSQDHSRKNVLHNALKQSSNLEYLPQVPKSMSLTEDENGVRVNKFSGKSSSVGPSSSEACPTCNGQPASNVFKMVIEKKGPKKSGGKTDFNQKITIIETERSKPMSTNELLRRNFNRTRRHPRHHPKRHGSRSLRQLSDDAAVEKTAVSDKTAENIRRIYLVKLDSDKRWSDARRNEHLLDGHDIQEDAVKELYDRDLKTALAIGVILCFVLLLGVVPLLVCYIHPGKCNVLPFQKHRVKSIRMYPDEFAVKCQGPGKGFVKDYAPLVHMSFESRRPQKNYVEEMEWQTESGDWLS